MHPLNTPHTPRISSHPLYALLVSPEQIAADTREQFDLWRRALATLPVATAAVPTAVSNRNPKPKPKPKPKPQPNPTLALALAPTLTPTLTLTPAPTRTLTLTLNQAPPRLVPPSFVRTLVGFQRDRAQIGQGGSATGTEGAAEDVDSATLPLNMRPHVRQRAPRWPVQSLVGWGYAHGAMPDHGGGGKRGGRQPATALWSLLSQEASPLRMQMLRLQRTSLPAYTEAEAASHGAARDSTRDRDSDLGHSAQLVQSPRPSDAGASISLASPPPPPRSLSTPPPSPPNGPAAASRDGSRDGSRRISAAERRASDVAAEMSAQRQSLRDEAAESLRELQARHLVIAPWPVT